MKSLNWNGLMAHKFKRTGLVFAGIFILLEIMGRVLGRYDKSLLDMTIYFIIYSLFVAIFSKEKIEDERIQIIRYFALKQTFSIIIVVLLTSNLLHFNFSYYSIIASMLCYFPIFELTNYFNPYFIFKEKTTKKNGETIVIAALMVGVFSSVLSIVLNFLM